MAFIGHVFRGSSGKNALQILEGKLEATTAQGRPRRMWLDDIKQWTQLNTYEDIKRLAHWLKIDVIGELVPRCVNLLLLLLLMMIAHSSGETVTFH